MRTRTTTAGLIAAGLLLVGCSSSSDPKPAPRPPTTTPATPTATATKSQADLIAACVTAIAAGKDDEAAGAPECADLPRADYYEALHQANQAAIDQFDQDTDEGGSDE